MKFCFFCCFNFIRFGCGGGGGGGGGQPILLGTHVILTKESSVR